jgi:hypothetical protein
LHDRFRRRRRLQHRFRRRLESRFRSPVNHHRRKFHLHGHRLRRGRRQIRDGNDGHRTGFMPDRRHRGGPLIRERGQLLFQKLGRDLVERAGRNLRCTDAQFLRLREDELAL